MPHEFIERLQQMPDAKKIAVAVYGESVASYRYGLLADKASIAEHRRVFTEMKNEELGHQQALENLLKKHYPDDDFVLTPEDKELVIVGNRLLELKDEQSFNDAMQFLHDTENRTGRFYLAVHELIPDGETRRFVKTMADECFEHARSLLDIKPE